MEDVSEDIQIVPRRYQLEILGMAIERNTIVLLEPGCGKIQIAVLLMKYIAQTLKTEGKKCLIIFLAPTVALVKQQFEVIKKHTNLQVAYYIGGKAVKDWNGATLNEVLVMTPQILLDGLDNSSLTLDMVSLMVLDECHLACKKHPYVKIMKAVQLYREKEKLCEMVTGTVETEKYALDDYLKDAHELLEEKLPSDVNELFKTPEGIENAVKEGILTPKMQLLLHFFLQKSDEDPEQVCCIVFVQRVIAAAVISSLIQQLDCLKCPKTDFLSTVTSTSGSKKQQKASEDFSAEKVQVLVATDVIEDGIDVKNCNCVICFDLPLTMHSYIQFRGHVRQENSEFILFLERGNEKQKKHLFNMIKSVASMEDTILNRDDTSIKEKNTIKKDVPGDADEHLPEMTLSRNVMPSIEEQNVVEKDVCKRLEESRDEHLLQMALNRNSMPCTKEQSVFEKGASKRLDEVEDVGEDLGGVSEREDKVGDVDEDLQRVIKKEDKVEEEKEVGKISTKSGGFASIPNEDVESNHPKKRAKKVCSLPSMQY